MKDVVYTTARKVVNFFRNIRHRKRFWVYSEEPFQQGMVRRGPFSHWEAQKLVELNTRCGAKCFISEYDDGILVPA